MNIQKQLIRSLALVMCACMLLTAIACGKADTTPTETTGAADATVASTTVTDAVSTEPAETQDPATVDELPEKNYNNETFSVMYRTEWAYEFIANEINGELINDAVYKRNADVEERFGVKLEFLPVNGAYEHRDSFRNTVIAAVNSGDDTYDMISCYQSIMTPIITGGYLYDINEMPHIDLSKVWWSQKVADAYTVADQCYMITGDISLSFWEYALVYFFNKKLSSEYQLPDLYQIVKDGKWTLDKVIELTNNVYSDLNGDGKKDKNDSFGFVSAYDNHIRSYTISSAIPVAPRGDDGYLTLAFGGERPQTLVEKLIALHYAPGTLMGYGATNDPQSGQIPTVFTENRALMMSWYLGNAAVIRDMEADFGILPYPKLDENQETYSTVSLYQLSMICFPNTIKDTEMCGMIAEAMCMESYHEVIPSYYDLILKAKNVRDEQSAEMVDLIRESITFDPGWVYGTVIGSPNQIIENLVEANNPNFASAFKAQEKAINKKVEQLNETFKKLAEG